MSEYDDLIEGYEPSVLAAEDPGPLTDEEFQRAIEMTEPGSSVENLGEFPTEVVDTVPPAELRVLKGHELPEIGSHYVIFEGIPKPVTRAYPVAEDAFVAGQLTGQDDRTRTARADRYLRTRYRGFLCGEIATL